MRTYAASRHDAPLLVLAHGAGAGEDHPWMRNTAEQLSAAGISVVTFEFPYMAARRKVPDRGPVLEQAYSEVWREVVTPSHSGSSATFAGGKSMGGRIATQAAARGLLDVVPSGLVCFGYPLHPPAKPAMRRDAHLPKLPCPILFVHGTRDPFGSPDEMRDLAARTPASTLELAAGGDHSLDAPRSTDKTGAIRRDAIAAAARWMLAYARQRGDRE